MVVRREGHIHRVVVIWWMITTCIRAVREEETTEWTEVVRRDLVKVRV